MQSNHKMAYLLLVRCTINSHYTRIFASVYATHSEAVAMASRFGTPDRREPPPDGTDFVDYEGYAPLYYNTFPIERLPFVAVLWCDGVPRAKAFATDKSARAWLHDRVIEHAHECNVAQYVSRGAGEEGYSRDDYVAYLISLVEFINA